MSYDDSFVAGLEWLWGEGFLSPGGPDYIADILSGTNLADRTVLDFGCGIGGIDRLLVTDYGALRVLGLDVVDSLIQRARSDAEKYQLSEQLEFKQMESEVLDFEDESFDVVFSKDAIIHLPDKQTIVNEFYRVLRRNGVLVGSDWLGSDATHTSERVREWLDFSKLDFHFCTAPELEAYFRLAGFESVQTRDRTVWYQSAVREEINRVSGVNRVEFVKRFGEEQADTRFKSSTLKMKVVDAGEMCPTLFRAVKTKSI